MLNLKKMLETAKIFFSVTTDTFKLQYTVKIYSIAPINIYSARINFLIYSFQEMNVAESSMESQDNWSRQIFQIITETTKIANGSSLSLLDQLYPSNLKPLK